MHNDGWRDLLCPSVFVTSPSPLATVADKEVKVDDMKAALKLSIWAPQKAGAASFVQEAGNGEPAASSNCWDETHPRTPASFRASSSGTGASAARTSW
jgi:hypothetical protein